MTLTYGSLFSGIGGMDLGLDRAGLTCSWQVEIDDYARRVLARHWPDVRRWDDVRTFPPLADAERLGGEPGRVGGVVGFAPGAGEEDGTQRQRHGCSTDHRGATLSDWSADLICGGFPCQDISFAGKGAGLAGERSGLWYEFARVVRVLRPRYVLVENVAALLVRGLDAVLGTLASLGYDSEWACLPAAAVGAPHIRDRVFIVAYTQSNVLGPDVRGARSGESQGRRQAEGGRVCQGLRNADDGRPLHPGPEAAGYLPHTIGHGLEGLILTGPEARAALGGHRAACEGGQWRSDPADEPESGVGELVDGFSARLARPGGYGFTPRVAAGVPDRVNKLRGLGNAVVPQVAEWLGRRILARAAATSAEVAA
jgi:DNA (cytosine-5)-methyltransferase 1